MEKAFEVGAALAKNNIGLVYGGASVGCMGAVAKGALSEGGEVIGVLPKFLNKREIAALNLTQLITVESMHERKLKMNQLSDGNITIPGGFGTFEELFEMATWGQLGLHRNPTAILNVNGYYDHLIAQMEHMVAEGLLKEEHFNTLVIEDDISLLLEKIRNYTPPKLEKWLTERRT
jgi:hypothetical protein